LRIPNAAGDIDIVVDLKAREIALSTTIDSPMDKRIKGQISWLARQLSDAPGDTTIDAFAKNARQPVSLALDKLRNDPGVLIEALAKRDVTRFRVVVRSDLGMNRKAGKKPGFVQSFTDAVESYYGDVLQNLVAYQPRAPRMTTRSNDQAPEDSTERRRDRDEDLVEGADLDGGAISPPPASFAS
jgi:hypothetical protein